MRSRVLGLDAFSVFFLLLAFAAVPAPSDAGTVFDVGADWSLAANPNGAWSYNQGSIPLPHVQANWGSVTGESFWTTTASGTVPPAWAKAVTSQSADHWEPGDVVGHSTNLVGGGATTNITWTSPGPGTITISGKAWDAGHAPGRDTSWRLFAAGDLLAQRGSIRTIAKSDSVNAPFSANLQPGKALTGLVVGAGDSVVFEIEAETDYGHFVGVALTIDFASAGLDHFMCYRTAPTRGTFCATDAPDHPGAPCDSEEFCGGTSGDETTDATSLCESNGFPKGLRASLADRFEPDARIFDVRKPVTLCAPADKNGEGIQDPDTHLQGFQIALTKGRCAAGAPANEGQGCTKEADCGGTRETSLCVAQSKSVRHTNIAVINQFHASGSPLVLDAIKPDRLLVPSGKGVGVPADPPGPNYVDHFKCYKVAVPRDAPKFTALSAVSIEDQFTGGPRVFELIKPTYLCAPADKNDEGIKDAATLLACYRAKLVKGLCAPGSPENAGSPCAKEPDCGGVKGVTSLCAFQEKFQKIPGIFVSNQFGADQLGATKEDEICVPSEVLLPE